MCMMKALGILPSLPDCACHWHCSFQVLQQWAIRCLALLRAFLCPVPHALMQRGFQLFKVAIWGFGRGARINNAREGVAAALTISHGIKEALIIHTRYAKGFHLFFMHPWWPAAAHHNGTALKGYNGAHQDLSLTISFARQATTCHSALASGSFQAETSSGIPEMIAAHRHNAAFLHRLRVFPPPMLQGRGCHCGPPRVSHCAPSVPFSLSPSLR